MAEVNDRLVVELSANVDKLLAGLKKAGDATSVWGDQAGRTIEKTQASFNGVSFDAAGGKMRAEVLKQIELQHQLDVARAAGDAKTVTALRQQIDLMQRIKQLRSAGLSPTDAPKAAEQQLAALAASAAIGHRRKEQEERAEKVRGNPGKALESTLARSRVGVLEEGGAKIPIFGSALEELGTAGFAAAGGVLAAAEAMEKAKEAAEYAEQVKNLADKLGVTTKDLQEYQFAAVASGVSVESLNSSLEEGNKVLGNYQSNIASAKSKKVFDALGITQEEARKAQTITDLLPEIAEKIKDLAPSEQAGIAERLGLSGMLPILQKGKEGIEELRHEAEGSGAVLDTELIRKGAEAAEKLKEAGTAVDVNLKRAFIGLAPYIAACLEIVAKLAKGIADTVERLGPISNYSRVHVNDELATSQKMQAFFRPAAGAIDPKTGFATGKGIFGNQTVAAGAYNNYRQRELDLRGRLAELDKIDAAAKPPPRKTDQLVADKTPKAKAAPTDQTVDLDKTATEAEASARKAYLEAQAALTSDIRAHAELEKQAVDEDLTKTLAQLSKDEADVRKAKVDAHRSEQLALLEKARTETQNAAAAKKELIDRNAQQAIRERELQIAAELSGYDQRIRTAEASLSGRSSDRIHAEDRNFRDTQVTQRDAKEAELDFKVTKHEATPAEEDQVLSRLDDTQRVERTAHKEQTRRQNDPLYALANPENSISDDYTGVEAKSVESLGEALKGVALGTKTVKSAFHDMAQSIISDLAEIAIKRGIEAPLAAALFGVNSPYDNPSVVAGAATSDDGFLDGLLNGVLHLAGGGPVQGPGGPRDDMIPTMLSNGEYVMPAGATSKYRGLLDAMRSGSALHMADGGLVGAVTRMSTPRMASADRATNLTVAVDANGAFSYQHVQDAVRRGVSEAVATSRRVVPMDLAARQRNTFPN